MVHLPHELIYLILSTQNIGLFLLLLLCLLGHLIPRLLASLGIRDLPGQLFFIFDLLTLFAAFLLLFHFSGGLGALLLKEEIVDRGPHCRVA